MAQKRAQKTRRVWLPAACFGAFAFLVLGRLVELQIIEHDQYAAAARTELAGSATIYASRGSILDRNGNVLASSVDTWDISVNQRAWQEKGPAASEKLAAALNMDAGELRAKVENAESLEVLVARDVDYETGKEILDQSLVGVILRKNTDRINPEGDVGASLLGFIGTDNVGLAGVEAAFNEALQGKPGTAIYERDTTGEPIPFGQYLTSEPEAGQDVVLTIDRYLQGLSEKYLAEAMEAHKAQGGSIIMMDPQTGDILALATSPGIKYSTLSDLDLSSEEDLALLRNPAVTDLYEPGSVMKVVTAAAAIDGGAVTPNTSYVDSGVVQVHGVPLRNWRNSVYGETTMTGVLVESINTGAVFMEEQLEAKSPGAFQRYLDAFGFGKPTGVGLTGEAEGIIRRPGDDNYSPVDLATQSFGQSISVTPIQMISAIAATINGGNLMRPRLVKEIVSADGERRGIEPEVVSHPISPETSAKIREMMHAVVDSPGRDHPGKLRDYTAGGKSGTANVPIVNGYDDRQVASFIGFAPLDNPRLLVLVKLDENQDLMTGTEAAAPVFAAITEEALHYLNVRPDIVSVAKP